MNLDDNFDDLFKAKLNNIKPEMDFSSFDRISASLEQSSSLEQEFDDLFHQKLTENSTPYNSQPWYKIEKELEDQEKKKIAWFNRNVTRVAMVAILLLLGYSGVSIFKLNSNVRTITASDQLIEQPVQNKHNNKHDGVSTTKVLKNANLEVAISDAENHEEANTKVAPANPIIGESITKNVNSSNTILSSILSNQKEVLANNNESENIETANDFVITPDLTKLYTSFGDIGSSSKNVLNDFSLLNNTDLSYLQKDIQLNPEQQAWSIVSRLSSKFSLIEMPQNFFPKIEIVKNSTGLRMHAGMVVSGDYNYILTPFDEDFTIQPYQHGAYGYGSGFSFGMSKKRWGLETGIQYASNDYTPKPIKEITGSLESGYRVNTLNSVELSLIKIPLNFKYSFDNSTNWNIYTVTGGTLNVSFAASYYKEATYSNISAASRSEEIGPSIIDSKPFTDGWFEGGAFKRNQYITANVGLGIERIINSNFSIYLEPTYQHNILTNGIGPYLDKFHTFSIQSGAKIYLSKD